MVPFFKIFGSKWQLAADLGPPQHAHVIEPFAGGAGYSTRWEPKRVTLIERDPVIAGVWSYLIKTRPEEIMCLPVHVDEMAELENNRKIPEEARNLIGFWFNSGVAQPAKRRSQWARWPCLAASYWGRTVRLQIASQVPKIRHWRIIEGSWENAPDVVGHWFIDPPYQRAGRSYSCNEIDYDALGRWARTRKGFRQVCEAGGAKWLPFKPNGTTRRYRQGGSQLSVEALFEMEGGEAP